MKRCGVRAGWPWSSWNRQGSGAASGSGATTGNCPYGRARLCSIPCTGTHAVTALQTGHSYHRAKRIGPPPPDSPCRCSRRQGASAQAARGEQSMPRSWRSQGEQQDPRFAACAAIGMFRMSRALTCWAGLLAYRPPPPLPPLPLLPQPSPSAAICPRIWPSG